VAISPEYREFLSDLLRPLGPVGIRRMFGGAGVFYGKAMFALIARETIFMKVDESNRADYEAEGAAQFTYESPSGKIVEFGYFELPERLLDEPDELVRWARKSVGVALAAERVKAAKAQRRPRVPKRKQSR
jgi:DNA transformation protein and related proteins